MLNIIDEFTLEALAIRVARRLNSHDVIDVLLDLFILRGVPVHIRSDNGPDHRQGGTGVDHRRGCSDRLHHARQSLGKRLHRKHSVRTAGIVFSFLRR